MRAFFVSFGSCLAPAATMAAAGPDRPRIFTAEQAVAGKIEIQKNAFDASRAAAYARHRRPDQPVVSLTIIST
jgi:hypothetical protein